jgi:hypothetical protein
MRFLIFSLLLAISLKAQRVNPEWTFVGPKSNVFQFKGLFTCVWTDPENLNHVMAGTPNGGLFYTTNALDENPQWKNITDGLPYMNFGVSSIVVIKGTNYQEIYISTYTGGGLLTKNFGNGILHTVNGGKSWSHVGPGEAGDLVFPLAGLVANPENQNQMIAYFKKDFYITDDRWNTFRKVELPFHNGVDKAEVADVEFAPFESGKLYVATKTYNTNKAQIFLSGDFARSWIDITPSDVSCERIAIATIRNKDFKGKFYITSGNRDVFVKYYNGLTFSPNLNEAPVRHLGANSYWCLELEVSDADTSVIYLSLTETSRSNNSGKNFVKIGSYNAVNTHADVRHKILPVSTKGGNNDVLILANDGGISMNNPFGGYYHPQFRNLNGNGLYANQFWGINVLQSDSLFIAGGAQDNGGFFIKPYAEKNNLHQCGDGYLALVLNDSIALVEGNPPNFLHFNFNTSVSTFISIPDNNSEARRPLLMHDSMVYVGYHDVWRAKVSDLVNKKFNFENISALPYITDPEKGIHNREIKGMCVNKFNNMLIAYAHPNWDAKANVGKLYFCPDVKALKPMFIDITSVAANSEIELCRWSHIESVAADIDDANTFYVIYKDVFDQRNSEIYKLVYDQSSHTVNLSKITYNLTKTGFNKLYTDRVCNMMYVAANDGLYYRNLRSNDSLYRSLNFFPKVLVSDVAINYYTNTLYVATFGRGIWRTQVPAFADQKIRLRKSYIKQEPFRIDGELRLAMGKKLEIKNKLIITSGSKIILSRRSKLILPEKGRIVNEYNQIIDVNLHIQKHPKSIVMFSEN